MTVRHIQPANLEEAFESIELGAETVLKALAAATKEARRAKSAAAVGQVRELQHALEAAVRLADQAADAANDLREAWRFDVGDWFRSGEYTKELLATANEEGVHAHESDQRILCYPAVVEVSAADTTVVIDKRKERRIRPSLVVRTLAALQHRPPKFKADAFIESLSKAYDLVVRSKGSRPGATMKLIDVHAVLTLMPGAAREYTKHEFARDLYLLDQSGTTVTKDGRTMNLPASALTRGSGVLVTVTRTGNTKVYAGIAFGEGLS